VETARRWQAPYREACAGPSVQLPVCIPDILEACSSADRTRSCFRLTSSRQDVASPETIPNGHYLDREGRCWTLYDGHVSGNYGAEGDPVDGTFRATAERCGARLEISGSTRRWLGSSTATASKAGSQGTAERTFT
jgi:hypothetical protein